MIARKSFIFFIFSPMEPPRVYTRGTHFIVFWGDIPMSYIHPDTSGWFSGNRDKRLCRFFVVTRQSPMYCPRFHGDIGGYSRIYVQGNYLIVVPSLRISVDTSKIKCCYGNTDIRNDLTTFFYFILLLPFNPRSLSIGFIFSLSLIVRFLCFNFIVFRFNSIDFL